MFSLSTDRVQVPGVHHKKIRHSLNKPSNPRELQAKLNQINDQLVNAFLDYNFAQSDSIYSVKRVIESILQNLWLSGVLFGASASQAYLVLCSESDNPIEYVRRGVFRLDIFCLVAGHNERFVIKMSRTSEVVDLDIRSLEV